MEETQNTRGTNLQQWSSQHVNIPTTYPVFYGVSNKVVNTHSQVHKHLGMDKDIAFLAVYHSILESKILV